LPKGVLGIGSSSDKKKVLSMAINLMDLVKTAINTSGVADQIGSAVGLEKSKTNSAIEAAIPVLLGGLMKKAATPGFWAWAHRFCRCSWAHPKLASCLF